MLLIKIKKILKEKGPSTIAALAKQTEYDESTVKKGIEKWIKKGSVVEISQSNKCTTCSSHCYTLSCTEPVPMYRWNTEN